jgi:hypothetical protein
MFKAVYAFLRTLTKTIEIKLYLRQHMDELQVDDYSSKRIVPCLLNRTGIQLNESTAPLFVSAHFSAVYFTQWFGIFISDLKYL